MGLFVLCNGFINLPLGTFTPKKCTTPPVLIRGSLEAGILISRALRLMKDKDPDKGGAAVRRLRQSHGIHKAALGLLGNLAWS